VPKAAVQRVWKEVVRVLEIIIIIIIIIIATTIFMVLSS